MGEVAANKSLRLDGVPPRLRTGCFPDTLGIRPTVMMMVMLMYSELGIMKRKYSKP